MKNGSRMEKRGRRKKRRSRRRRRRRRRMTKRVRILIILMRCWEHTMMRARARDRYSFVDEKQ